METPPNKRGSGTILSGLPVAVGLLDAHGMLIEANPAFRLLLGPIVGDRPTELAIPFFDFLDEREADRLGPAFRRYLAGFPAVDPSAEQAAEPTMAHLESQVQRQDGASVYLGFELSGPSPLPAFGGATVCVVEDLSGRKRREDGLISAKAEAERALLTREQFIANISHEIRTPIQTIIGTTELLTATKLDFEQREYLSQVSFSAEVLLGLVNDILDFSKIEAGRFELELIDFDLVATIERSADMVALEAHRKGLELILDISQDLPALVHGDPTRLRQILVNLVKNAVKFTNTGEVYISARRERGGHDRVRIEVADTGIGVPPEMRELLFSSFFQGDASHTRKYGGSGLGLAITKHLVELMGGEVGLRPNEGEGTVFHVIIPFQASRLGRIEEGQRLNGRLLIVDDRVTARLAGARLVSHTGLEVDSASSGAEALERLEQAKRAGRPYDLCLIDQNMPNMDGWRLAAEIGAREDINSARLILMVPEGAIGPEAKMKLLNWFNGYVNKPLKRRELFEVLAKASGQELDLQAPSHGEGVAEEGGLARVSATVLLAEDHPINQDLFRIILEGFGCEVALANDGSEAVELFVRRPFDVVFMDIQMPKMNGYQAANAIRKTGSKVPIIAVTAGVGREDRALCLEAGMNDILTKPFRTSDIHTMLVFWLKRAPADEEGQLEELSELEREQLKDPEVFDFDQVMETFLGNSKAVVALVSKFIERTKQGIRQLDEALKSGDLSNVAMEAHAIKGSAWNLGARRLGNAAMNLERAAKTFDGEANELAMTGLREAFFEFAQYAQYFVTSSY